MKSAKERMSCSTLAASRALATALLKEYHEDWITGRRYLRMEPLREREPPEDLKPAA